MGTNNICLYKEVDKKDTGCNLQSTKLLDYAFIGVCAVIRSNTVFIFWSIVVIEPNPEFLIYLPEIKRKYKCPFQKNCD